MPPYTLYDYCYQIKKVIKLSHIFLYLSLFIGIGNFCEKKLMLHFTNERKE